MIKIRLDTIEKGRTQASSAISKGMKWNERSINESIPRKIKVTMARAP